MAGYLGNSPSESSVRIARQIYTTSGVTTDFTFTSGYDPGYVDVYVNGERQTEGTNFTANDSSVVTILNGGVSSGSTVEVSAYKSFNVATVTLGEVTDVDDLTISGSLVSGSTVVGSAVTSNLSGINVTGVVTATSFSGDGSALTGLASTDIINAEQVNVSGSTTTGIATVSTSVVVGSAVTVTATAITIDPAVTTTIGDDAQVRFGTGNDLSIYHNGTNSLIDNTTGTFYLRGDDLQLTDYSATDKYVDCTSNGTVDLYHNNVKTFATDSNGILVQGPEAGSALIRLYADEGDDNADRWRILNDHSSSNDLSIQNYSTGSWVSGLTLDSSNNATFSGRMLLGTTTEGEASADNLTIADSANCGISIRSGTSSESNIFFSDGTSGSDEYMGAIQYKHASDSFEVHTNATAALTLDSSQNATFAGTISDSKGNVRSIIQNSTTGTYSLVASDAGKHVLADNTVTIPNSTFAAGDAVTIINNSASDITLTASVGTLYNTADASTGGRTLAARGMATVLFSSATVAYISGAGLS